MSDIFEQEQEGHEPPPAILKLMIAFDDAVDDFAPTSVEAISAAVNILSVSLIRHFKERRSTVPEALMRAFMKQLHALVALTMNDGGTA